MDLQSEKAEVLKKFERVNDLSVVLAIKSLLDAALDPTSQDKRELDDSLARGIFELDSHLGVPHEQVMKEMRLRYEKDE